MTLDDEERFGRMAYFLHQIRKLIRTAKDPKNKGKDPSFIFDQIERCLTSARRTPAEDGQNYTRRKL